MVMVILRLLLVVPSAFVLNDAKQESASFWKKKQKLLLLGVCAHWAKLTRTPRCKSFLVLFSKKELLALFSCQISAQ
jgi:hypothetical protein